MSQALDISTLTAARQDLLVKALGGHTITLGEGFTSDSRRSLESIGLTPVEISGLEQANRGNPAAAVPTVANDQDPSNPWTKAGFNLTRQSQIKRENPEFAAELKRKAGR
jgi:hypothetical protein